MVRPSGLTNPYDESIILCRAGYPEAADEKAKKLSINENNDFLSMSSTLIRHLTTTSCFRNQMLPPCVGARLINHATSEPGRFVFQGNKAPAFGDARFR